MSEWYKTGDEAEQKMEQDEERRSSEQSMVFRLWMPAKSELYATFLDDLKHPAGYKSPFVYEEHNLFLNGHWRNWFTCIDGLPHPETGKPQKCPLCAMGTKESKVYLASAYTIIDHSRWESKKNKGQIHEHELKLFVCKAQVQKILRKQAKKKKGLRGWYVEISRTDGTSPNTGDQFDWESQMTDEEFSKLTGGKFKELPPPLDYHELFKPKTEEEIRQALGGGTAKGGYDTAYESGADAEDAFVKF